MAWLHTVIDVPPPLHAATADFWSRALGWRAGPPWPGHAELRSLEPGVGDAYVHLQQVGGPPRVHLDVEAHDPAAAVSAAVVAGAELLGRSQRWHTLRSPGGLPFCVLQAQAHQAPEPVT